MINYPASNRFDNITSYYKLIEEYYKIINEEIVFRHDNGIDNSYLELKYLSKMFDRHGFLIKTAVAGYAARLQPLIKILQEQQSALSVLDVGCGCGTESLLMSLLGADVTGLDLVQYRIDYARSRIPYYKTLIGDSLQINFECANVLKYLKANNNYDIIWLIEAISHVHPAEDFFKIAYDNLKAGGFLIIADSNAHNPISWYRAYRIRGNKKWYVLDKFPLMDKNNHDEVAEERIFSIHWLKKELLKAGFKTVKVEMSGFMGSYFLPKAFLNNDFVSHFLIKFQNIMKRLPWIKLLGSNFTLVAQK